MDFGLINYLGGTPIIIVPTKKFKKEHIRKRELIRSGLNDMDLPFPKH